MIGKTNIKVKPNKKINYVEYIESTGTQYIDTGVVPTNKTKWVLDYQFLADTNANGAETAQNGCGYWSDSERFVIGYGGGQLNVAIGVNGASTVNGDTARHTFILDTPNKTGYVDDIAIPCNYTSYSTDDTICFFTRNENASTSKFIHRGRLYGSKIYENGVLIRDFRPAIKEGVYYLYDEVEKKYYYNQGTGQFIGDGWEPTQLEYIESTGTQYIDTGIVPKSTTRIETKMSFEALESTTQINGWQSSGNAEAFFWGIGKSSNAFVVCASAINNPATTGISPDDNYHIFSLESGKQSMDGITYGSNTMGDTAVAGQTLYLFGYHGEWDASGVISPFTGKLCYLKHYEGDELVNDFIPALDENGVACLYDKVSKTCFYNAGTGSFLGGASI